MIKAIAFDCFGVIINDNGHNWVDSAGFSTEVASQVHELFRQRDLGLLEDEAYYAAITEATGADPQVLRDKEYGARPIDPMLVSYIKNQLAHKYSLYLASNAGASLVDNLMEQIGLSEVFDYSFVSSQMGVIKPQEGFYAAILSTVGIEAKEILFVDDRLQNVEAARHIGMQGHHYRGFGAFKAFIETIQ